MNKKITLGILLFFLLIFNINADTINTPYLNWFINRAKTYDVPLNIALAVAIVESNITMVTSNRNYNGSHDIGIFQLNSHFIKWFERTLWYNNKKFNPYDPKNNIEMGIIYLKYLYKYTGSWDKAIKAFNIGLSALSKNPNKANKYLVKITKVLSTLEIKEN